MKKFLAILVVLALVLSLSACATPAESPEKPADQPAEAPEPEKPADQPEAEEPPESPAELTSVTIVMPRSIETLVDTIIWAADKLGYFEENGIQVTVQEATGVDVQMVAAGQADFAVPAPSSILPSIEAGLEILAVEQYGAWNIFGFSALNDSGIDTWEDISGKTIALGDASWEALAQPLLDAAGVTDIEYVVAGENRYIQVEEGKIDVLFTWLDEIYMLQAQGMDFNYIDGNDVLKNSANSWICSKELIDTKPEVVQGFVKAIQMGTYFVAMNQEAAADISLEKFPQLSSTVDWPSAVSVQKAIKVQSYGVTDQDFEEMSNPTGFFFESKWDLNIDAALVSEIISEKIPHDEVYTNEFVLNGMNDEDKVRVEKDAADYVFVTDLAKAAGN